MVFKLSKRYVVVFDIRTTTNGSGYVVCTHLKIILRRRNRIFCSEPQGHDNDDDDDDDSEAIAAFLRAKHLQCVFIVYTYVAIYIYTHETALHNNVENWFKSLLCSRCLIHVHRVFYFFFFFVSIINICARFEFYVSILIVCFIFFFTPQGLDQNGQPLLRFHLRVKFYVDTTKSLR